MQKSNPFFSKPFTNWNSSYFKKVFITVLSGTGIVLFLSLSALYMVFHQMTLSYMQQVNHQFLIQLSSFLQQKTATSFETVLNGYSSASGKILMASNPASEQVCLQAMRDIDYFITQDPIIHTAYFYNASTQKVYMFGQNLLKASLDDLADSDAEIIPFLLKEVPTPPNGFPRSISVSRHSSDFISIGTRIFYMDRDNVIVVNLKLADLFDNISSSAYSTYSDTTNQYCLFYNNETLAYASPGIEFSEEENLSKLLTLLNEHQWNETFSTNLCGTDYQITSIQVPQSMCQFVSLTRQADVTRNFVPYFIAFSIVVLIALAIAVGSNMHISATLYRPIESLSRIFSSPKPDSVSDELQYIHSSISHTLQQLDSLSTSRAQQLPSLHSQLLKQQLLYNRYSDDTFWEKCKQQDLNLRAGNAMVVVYARWDSFASDIDQQNDQRVICCALSNVFHELLDSKISIFEITFDYNGIAFLCSFPNVPAVEDPQKILLGIQETFHQYFELDLSFFLSHVLYKPSELCDAMHRLQGLSHYRYFYNGGVILDSYDFNPDTRSADLPALPDMGQLETLLRSSDRDACAKILNTYFDSLQSYTFESTQASINMLASRLISVMKKLQATQINFPPIDQHEFFSTVASAHNLAAARQAVDDALQQIMDSAATTESETSRMLADEVIQYLDKNFQDYNLSSKSIAQEHHISVPYLNRLFKQKTGETIASYLKRLRLKYAQQLLLDTNLSVESIARKAGFENTKYFYTLFRNEFGVSPSNYRISRSITDSSDNTE